MISDIIGKTIGVFDVICDSGERNSSGNVLWKVRCHVCGGNKTIPKQQLFRYKSCGCISKDLQSKSLRTSLNRGGCGEIFATHWNVIKKNALSRNLKFEVSVKTAWDLFLNQNRQCALTGVQLQFSTRCWSRDATASLDRINSDLGYVAGNLQWVHKNINMMKQQYSTQLFFDWCKKVCLHNNLLQVI